MNLGPQFQKTRSKGLLSPTSNIEVLDMTKQKSQQFDEMYAGVKMDVNES